NCLSRKNNCSPAMNTNWPPQSTQVKSRSTNSIPLLPRYGNDERQDWVMRNYASARGVHFHINSVAWYGAHVVGRRHSFLPAMTPSPGLPAMTLGRRWVFSGRVRERLPDPAQRQPFGFCREAGGAQCAASPAPYE